jgi:hypothetical protein
MKSNKSPRKYSSTNSTNSYDYVRNRSRSPRKYYTEPSSSSSDSYDYVRNRSRSPRKYYTEPSSSSSDSYDYVRNRSRSPRKYYTEPSSSSSDSYDYGRNRSPVRRISPVKEYEIIPNEIKFNLYQPQEEYVFPIGLHQDIDQSIIEKLDFFDVIKLLKINKSPDIRKLIYHKLQEIINNTNNYDKLYFIYELLKINELILLKKLNPSAQDLKRLGIDHVYFDDLNILNSYISLLNEKEIKSFVEREIPEMYENDLNMMPYIIQKLADLLEIAIKIENNMMINVIKQYYKVSHFDLLYKQLIRFNNLSM